MLTMYASFVEENINTRLSELGTCNCIISHCKGKGKRGFV